MATKIDCLLLVIDWGGTSKTLVAETLAASEVSGSQFIGAVLSRVDMNLLPLYQEHAVAS
jgi:succinoglycan biosynthesis transport protein ExoP